MDADITVMSAARLNFVAENVPDVNLFDLPEDERNCPICLKPYVQEEPRKPYLEREEEGAGMLRCGHVFGQQCLEEWIVKERENTCPVCRAVIYEGISDGELDNDDETNELDALVRDDLSEDELRELFRMHLEDRGAEFGDMTGGYFDDFDAADHGGGEEQTGGDWDDRWGRLGWDRTENEVAGDLDSEQEGIDSGAWFQPENERYGLWPEDGSEAKSPTFVAGLEDGQRTIDDDFGSEKQPPVEANQET